MTAVGEVTLYTSPWVSGTRAAAYFGPISMDLFRPDSEITDREQDWTKAETELLEGLRLKASLLGANSIVALEVTLDPFARKQGVPGLSLHAIGTAAKLEPLR